MAFQGSAFQGTAFQTEIPVPPEPPAPTPGGIPAVLEAEDIRRFGTVRVLVRVSGTGRIGLDEEDLRRRVRDYLVSLFG